MGGLPGRRPSLICHGGFGRLGAGYAPGANGANRSGSCRFPTRFQKLPAVVLRTTLKHIIIQISVHITENQVDKGKAYALFGSDYVKKVLVRQQDIERTMLSAVNVNRP